MPCSIPPSNLAAFIARYLAQLEAIVIAKVYEEVNKIIEKLLNQACPPVEELKKILQIRDNLLNMINGLEKKIQPVKKFADQLEPPIQAAQATVLVLEQIPIKTTIGTPPTGGPSDVGGQIFSISIGAQNRFAQLLNLACQIVDLLMKDVQAIRDLTDISFDGLDPVKQKLQSIDIKLFECVEALPQDQKEEVLALIENLPSNAGISGIDAEGNYFYKNYKITIQEDKNSPGFAKRRFAQVENDRGVVVMRGPASFSSSTRVLVDEIKFRIDNQLP